MKQRFFILVFLVLVIAALIGLNAVSYTKTDKVPDNELYPNRSSYNYGTTGTSVFYSLLAETGNKVVRWQQPPSALFSTANSRIATLVLMGETRREVTDDEARRIMAWVEKGGKLVVIDRQPNSAFLQAQGNWNLYPVMSTVYTLEAGPEDPAAAYSDHVPAAKPVQPTALIKGINAVQPSKLASSISLNYSPPAGGGEGRPAKTPAARKLFAQPANNNVPQRIGTPGPSSGSNTTKSQIRIGEDKSLQAPQAISGKAVPTAPIVHLSNSEKDILADFNYGAGRVIFLSDPYIVSNAGIKQVDNSTLAINMVAAENGTIAFDEYHQGYGSENTFLRYFAGTPVPALLAQGFLLVLVLLWTQGRRFARPLPAPVKDRRSKLEYVAAMADLQRSTRAYDLAIENIYTQIKRDMTRLVGADNTIPRKQLAEAVAERARIDAKSLYLLMAKCEDIIHGEPTNAKETMNLIGQLRELEEKLGLHRNRTSRVK